MAIQTVTQRNTLAAAYGSAAAFGALYTAFTPPATFTEATGGSPAYARKALSWGAPSASVVTVVPVFDVGAGQTIVGAGVHTLVTAGTYLDGVAVTSQAFASQGTYTVTFTYTQA